MAWLRRVDTLFLRLFLLMWVTLVLSHALAFGVVTTRLLPHGPAAAENGAPWGPPPAGGPSLGDALPTMPSLPPDLPGRALWVDYGLRVLVIGLGAFVGARWLSAPMTRLSRAADALAHGLDRQQPLPSLDEAHGTREVREAARVFNLMAHRLQEQFDARGMHLAAVSHDLRTPLARLRLRLEDLPAELTAASAGDIREMDELIDSTLAVLREQRSGGEARPVEMRALLEAIADDHAVGGADVTLAEGSPARALGRPAALKRIVGNLVSNALRYGGRARLAVTQDAHGVRVTVDDDGPGIPLEELEQAFRPWVRLQGSHARAGHGLGLAIARDLAERDGGQLTLANREGGGLRATLRLPPAPSVSPPTRGG